MSRRSSGSSGSSTPSESESESDPYVPTVIPGWFTLAEASRLLGVKTHTLYMRMMRYDRLDKKKVGTVWFLSADDVVRLYEQLQMDR